MTLLAIAPVVLLVVLSSAPADAGQQVREEQIPALLNEQHRAAELYRAGRTDEAFRIFDARSPSLNARLAEVAAASMAATSRLRLKLQEGTEEARPWTPELARALAAVHMDAALRAYERRDSVDRFRTEAAAGARLFSAAAGADQGSGVWDRWILAIGVTALSDGQLWWASEILAQACRRTTTLNELLVACGSVHAAVAALPAHILLNEGRSSGTGVPEFDVRSYQEAEARRRHHLGTARRYFNDAVRTDSGDPEARIRLAWVQLKSGETEAAATGLEHILEDEALDRRAAFLVRLFLGRARQGLGDLGRAVALFREAVAIAPSAQSAHVALAAALHRQGAVREAAAVTRQLFETPLEPPDPWASYHYGPFWIVEPLLATLRSEARR